MSETNDQDTAKTRLSLRPAGRLELGRTVDAGSVRQSFSHGRSKVVQVEVRKKRAPVPGQAGPGQQTGGPSSGGLSSGNLGTSGPATGSASSAPAMRGAPQTGRPQAAPRALTATELA